MGKAKSAKKRWRKNDISDIEAALVKERQFEEHLGTKPESLHKISDSSLFKVDKSGSKSIRKKEFYRKKVLSYEKSLQASHILSPIVPQIKSTTEKLTMAERIVDKRLRNAEKRKEKALAAIVLNNAPYPSEKGKVYDIWNTPAKLEKPFYGKPRPQKALIRKPSELPAIEFPGTESSYNPSQENIEKIEEKIKKKELKQRKELERLERAVQPPEKLRTAYEIKKSLPKLTEKELLKIKKDSKKSSRKKPSKPYQGVVDKHYSSKMSITQRNKQKRRKDQITLERNIKIQKKRNEDLDNVENYTLGIEKKHAQGKKLREIAKIKRKLNAFKTKNLKQRYIGVPFLVKNRTIGGSLRNLMPYGNELKERTARYEQRNMVVA